MAQILHESGGLAIQFENLNYSAERLNKSLAVAVFAEGAYLIPENLLITQNPLTRYMVGGWATPLPMTASPIGDAA